MRRQAFRVLLMRVTPERTLFQALTVSFVVLLALAAAALLWDAWRWHLRHPLSDADVDAAITSVLLETR
jgi:hypothetical protein